MILSAFTLNAQWATDPNNNLIVGYGLDPHICSDSAGGCYITYDYNSTSYPRWLALERLDKYGYKPWGTLKRILGELPGQSKAEITENGEGGVIISYEDRDETVGWTARIRVQKVDSNGNFLWGPTGVKVTLDEINQGSQKIVNDGEGGAVVIWVNTLAEYKVNRISSDGQRMWGDSGIVAGINGWYDPALLIRTTGDKYVVSAERNKIKCFDENGIVFYIDSVVFWLSNIISDGKGGSVLSGKVWNGMIPKLVAQRRDSIGNNLWQEPYVEIADSLYLNTQVKIQLNEGFYYYGWSGIRNGINRVAQFQALRSDGSKLFTEGSISLSEHTPLSVAGIIESEASKIIIIWNDATISSTTIAQMYDTLGNKLWDESGVIVSYPAIAYQTYTTDTQEGFIISGTVNEFTVEAQQVSKYGNLGEIITTMTQEYPFKLPLTTILFQNFPNPFNSTTHIKYQVNSEGRIRIVLYNILGEELKILSDENKTIGTYSLTFSTNEIPSGVYLYTLETGSEIKVKKLTILK